MREIRLYEIGYNTKIFQYKHFYKKNIAAGGPCKSFLMIYLLRFKKI